MSTVDVRSTEGKVVGTAELPEEIFGIEPNVPVMHQVVTAQLAHARSGTHKAKTRAEVAGGGAKPWRQKGTGRARQGSTRAPHWRGGGVAHGPKPHAAKGIDYSNAEETPFGRPADPRKALRTVSGSVPRRKWAVAKNTRNA